METADADDDTAYTDAERSLGDAAKDLVARSPESTARDAKFGAELVTPTRLTGRKLAGPIVQPNVEYETPVKDSQVAHNPTSSVHDAKRLTGQQTADPDQRQISGAPKPEAAHDQMAQEPWKAWKELPGRYTVIRAAGVMPTMQTLSGDGMPRLTVGQSIEVLEIVHCAEARRVRARIAEPPGWISLANMDTGTRWAVHADDVADTAFVMACLLSRS